MNTTRRHTERLDPAAIEQHDRLAMRIWKSVVIGAIGLGFALWMWYLSSIGAITPDNDNWIALGLAGWLTFIVCCVGALMFSLMIRNLPDVQISRSHEVVMEAETRPRQVHFYRHVSDNTIQVFSIEWDMNQDEAEQFAEAVYGRESITRDLIKKRTDIKSINARYKGWIDALEKVGAVERVGRRVMITDMDVIGQYLPESE